LDDDYLIYKNPAVQSITLRTIKHVFTTFDPQLYIPFTFVSWQVTHALFGLNPFFYHVGNLILHGMNAILLMLLVEKITKSRLVAFLTAVFFLVHPLQTEAVLWATSRKDVLSGVFFFSSLYSYLRYRERDDTFWYWLSICAFLCGLLSKVSVIMLPAIIVLVDWFAGRARESGQLRRLMPFAVLCGIFLGIAFVGKSGVIGSSGLAMDLFLPSKSTLFYLWKIAWPVNFSVIYPQNEILSFSSPTLILTILGVVALGLIALGSLLTMRWRIIGFALAWYLLLLVPSYSTFLKNGFLYFASDRYAYLASAGIFLLVATAIVSIIKRKPQLQTVVMGLVILIMIVLPVLTARQAKSWANTEALYRNVLRTYPQSAMAHNNLGMTVDADGKKDEAMREYKEAIAIDPYQSIPYFNIAALLGEQGKYDEQLRMYQTIIDIVRPAELARPSELQRFFWLEEKFDRLGKPEDAERLLSRLLELVPQYPELHAERGFRLMKADKRNEAFSAFVEADKRGSDDPNVYYYLAEFYSEQNKDDDLIRVLRRAVTLDPANTVAAQQLERLER
jgi:tetratricopeptide (TPR) repeat protein